MPVQKQQTVRMNQAAKQKLDKIRAQTGLSQTVLLDRAVDLLEREILAERLEADFKDLVADSKMLRAYKEMSEIFDGSAS